MEMVCSINATRNASADKCRIFIIEGIPTVFMGIATLWLLPNNPETVNQFIHIQLARLTQAGLLPYR